MKEKHTYAYDGSVKSFDDIVSQHWKAKTVAVSEDKARSNLIFQYKKEHKLSPSAKITLTGKIYMVG